MRKVIYEIIRTVHMIILYVVMLLIDAGLWISKKLVGLTGWRITINAYKYLHICGEKLSRHIRRMI